LGGRRSERRSGGRGGDGGASAAARGLERAEGCATRRTHHRHAAPCPVAVIRFPYILTSGPGFHTASERTLLGQGFLLRLGTSRLSTKMAWRVECEGCALPVWRSGVRSPAQAPEARRTQMGQSAFVYRLDHRA
jgi:hypothetical protein